MPRPTFDNITHEKRERVLREAARLFAERGYAETDMNLLAARAGVAKGSLYDYFESKEDLYLHVCRDGLERSRVAVYGELDRDWDIYRQLEHVFRRGIQFALQYPEYVAMYLNVSVAGMERFAEKLSREVEKHTADYLKALLKDGIVNGVVRADINVNLSAFLINSLYVTLLVSLVSRHFQIRMEEYLEIEEGTALQSIDEHLDAIMMLVRNLLKL